MLLKIWCDHAVEWPSRAMWSSILQCLIYHPRTCSSETVHTGA